MRKFLFAALAAVGLFISTNQLKAQYPCSNGLSQSQFILSQQQGFVDPTYDPVAADLLLLQNRAFGYNNRFVFVPTNRVFVGHRRTVIINGIGGNVSFGFNGRIRTGRSVFILP